MKENLQYTQETINRMKREIFLLDMKNKMKRRKYEIRAEKQQEIRDSLAGFTRLHSLKQSVKGDNDK